MALLGNLTGSSQFFNTTPFYNGAISTSYRNDNASDAHLYVNKGGNGDRQTFTISWWMKIGTSLTGTIYTSGYSGSGGSASSGHIITSSNKVRMQNQVNNSAEWTLDSTRLFRDVSAWYNCVLAVDTTQGTEANRIKLYVNGVQETLSGSYPSQNANLRMNNQYEKIGTWDDGGNRYFDFDGYFADFNLIDGTQLDASSFGEFKNGVWIPVDTSSLTRGTKGWRLQFKQVGVGTASSSTVGADTGGNDFHFTSSGIVASDCAMPDSPENNFATMNPLDVGGAITYSEGNLKMVVSSGSMEGSRATMALPQSGKWYWEVGVTALGYISQVGIATHEKLLANTADGAADHIAWGFGTWMSSNNSSVSKYQVNVGGSGGDNWVAIPATGDVLGLAYDADNGKLWFAKNGTYQNTSGTANPATGDDPRASSLTGKEWFPLYAGYPEGSPAYTMNFGQDSSFAGTETAQGNTDENGIGDFYYAPPSGFLALCSANLPEPTISPNSATQADDYFNTVIYTGDDNANRGITGVGFKPDFLWHKTRNATNWHFLFDSSRGVDKRLSSNETNAEGDATGLDSFDSDGFTVDHEPSAQDMNASAHTYVAWNWKANGGTTSSNSDGSITSTVQANTDAGFSIVTYSGNATSGATVGHGLGVAPKFVIIKNRDTAGNWTVRTTALDGSSDYFQLNLSDAISNSSRSAPTSTVFSIGSGDVENKSGDDLVAYCFAEVEGYSKFGSYTGNGSTDGTFVFTGFRPAWVMFKKTSASDNWVIIDSTRDVDNVASQTLYADGSFAEDSNVTNRSVDFLSNGFKLRSSGTYINLSGGSFVYMAFAEAPFKYANAR